MSLIEKYTDPANPGSFSGLSGFKKNNKFSNYKDLSNLSTYSLHKKAIRKFTRRKTIVSGIDEQWQIDLVDTKKFKYHNSHYQYILCCIDVLSKYAWVEPIKDKTAKSCSDAFKKIFDQGRIPKYIYSDWGNEFKGECRALFQKHGITQIDTKSDNKASVVERFNRTIQERIERFYTYSGKKQYIHVLKELVSSYNRTYHTSIKMKPSDVSKQNENMVRETLYGKNDEILENDYHVRFSFKIGDYVRLAVDKTIFDKGYAANWSKEIYIICFLNPSNPPNYKIQTIEGQVFEKNYYKEQLQSVPERDFPFDSFEILDKKKDNFLVKKLNTENQETKWVKRILPDRSAKRK